MQSINFDDGFKEYDINGDESRVIRVNVTDFNILSRRDKAIPEIERIGREMAESSGAPEELAEFDRRFREQINFIFGTDVCTAAFGATHCMSIVSDGSMLFTGFVEALMAQVEKDMGVNISGFRLNMNGKDRTEQYISPVIASDNEEQSDPIEGMTPEEKDELLRKLIK